MAKGDGGAGGFGKRMQGLGQAAQGAGQAFGQQPTGQTYFGGGQDLGMASPQPPGTEYEPRQAPPGMSTTMDMVPKRPGGIFGGGFTGGMLDRNTGRPAEGGGFAGPIPGNRLGQMAGQMGMGGFSGGGMFNPSGSFGQMMNQGFGGQGQGAPPAYGQQQSPQGFGGRGLFGAMGGGRRRFGF